MSPIPVRAPAVKSTNVRTRLDERLWPLVFGVLERAAPTLAGAWADRLFFTPPRQDGSARLRASLATARAFEVTFGSGRLPAWRWGVGPTVLLVHGWGGRGGQLWSFVPPLVEAGLSVVAFDAPAHGGAPGRRTSIPEMAGALRRVAETAGPVHGIIAHSVGAPVTTLALRRGLPCSRAVFLAPAADPDGFTRVFAARLGLGPAGLAAMKRRAERRLGLRWRDLNVPAMARGLSVPLLVIHDREDEEIGWADGVAIARAWPDAELVATSGLGHRRLLRDPGVVARAVAFVAAGVRVPTCGHGSCTGNGAGRCATCDLEEELFDADLRWARAATDSLDPQA